tara:strand:- start:26128 stop:26760 length:633 start_codon:yes stop_codon:yes gene_type:complete
MALKDRKIIKEEIVEGFFGDLNEEKRKHPIKWWFTKWFYYKPSWAWGEFTFWCRRTWQKLRSGYSHYDAWDFKSQHAKWCVPRLKHLRDNHVGYPVCMEDENDKGEWSDTQSVFPADSEEGRDHFDKYGKRWETLLDKMIWSFEHLDDLVEPIYPDDYDKRQNKITYDDGCVAYEALDKRKPDYTPIEEHRKKVQEGLDLFAKYYENLWD